MDMFAHKPYTSNFKSIVLDSYVYSATNQIFIFLFLHGAAFASICRNAPCGFPLIWWDSLFVFLCRNLFSYSYMLLNSLVYNVLSFFFWTHSHFLFLSLRRYIQHQRWMIELINNFKSLIPKELRNAERLSTRLKPGGTTDANTIANLHGIARRSSSLFPYSSGHRPFRDLWIARISFGCSANHPVCRLYVILIRLRLQWSTVLTANSSVNTSAKKPYACHLRRDLSDSD